MRRRLITLFESQDRFFWWVLAGTLLVRLVAVFFVFGRVGFQTDDALYYLELARHPFRILYSANAYVTTVGPLYPFAISPIVALEKVLGRNAFIILLLGRVLQSFIDTGTVALLYLLVRRLFDERVARVAMVAQALDPRYILQAGVLGTETLFIFMMVWFVLLYVRAVETETAAHYRVAAVVLVLAILTRPVPLLFPLLLIGHAFLYRGEKRRATLRGAAWLNVVTLLFLVPWMIRGTLNTGQFVPVSDTAYLHFWQSTRIDSDELGGESLEAAALADTGYDPDLTISDIRNRDFLRAGLQNIAAAPGVWLGHVLGDALGSYLQPYGTQFLMPKGNPSAHEALSALMRGEIGFGEFLALPGLFRRLLIYLWHYWALLLGLAGLVMTLWRRQWNIYPLVAWVVYNTVVLIGLLIEPRYLFPLAFAFTTLAAYVSLRLWDAIRAMRTPPITPTEAA